VWGGADPARRTGAFRNRAMNAFGKLFERLDRASDLILAIAVLVAIGLMIVRIPPHAMDYFIAINLGVSVIILLTALYIRDLLKFPAFPTILLLTTLFRLSLNVASTRLILLEANAGDIIYGFGNVVVGGNFVVGGVVFLVLVLIQFLVIAKGAERVAEVGARFTLDAMPGKQSSIDFDMQQGLITPDQARSRRRELEKESKLYGAMDGAMKFVKGDAIAGIIISLVNIVGGLIIGVMQMGMTAGEAAQVFSILTIGDGLVSQLPALFTSVAAGIAVTRVAQSNEDKPSNLGQELFRQLIENPGALRIAGGLFLITGAYALFEDIGFPGPPFLALGGVFVVLAIVGKIVEPLLKDIYAATPKPAPKVEGKEGVDPSGGIFIPPPLVIEFNAALAPVFGKDRFDEPRRAVDTELRRVRERLTMEFGFQVPPIEIVPRSSGISTNGYVIYAFDGPILHAKYHLGSTATLKPLDEIKEKAGDIECEEIALPGKRLNVRLVPNDRVKDVIDENVDVKWSSFAFFLMSVDVAIRRNLHLFVGLQETHILLKSLEQKWPELVQAVYPKRFSLQQVCDVLKHLLREQVPIGDLRAILEAMARWTAERKAPEEVGEAVRNNLRRALYARYAGNDGRTVECYYLQPDLEQALLQARAGTPVYEELRMNIADAAKRTISPARHLLRPPVLLVRYPELRWALREEFERSVPELVVLSAKDFPPDLDKKGLGVVIAT
jgi:type III secretion protein V